ncbi:MAG: amidophosphoribosyltransferase [Vicingaceae bacterium]|nr:MAG: amidophosphoribosyltransferase [Vicingaceae bacterium]
MNRWLKAFGNLLYPSVCPGCEENSVVIENCLCFHCFKNIPVFNSLDPFVNRGIEILASRLPVRMVFILMEYHKNSLPQKLIHSLKYKNNPEIGVFLGKKLGDNIFSYLTENKISFPDAIVPVPLHLKKIKQRGYNQSECIAQGIAEALQTDNVKNILQRTKYTLSQTTRSKEERWNNIKDAFQVCDDTIGIFNSILLVDDVLTTGSTIEACIHTLLQKKSDLIIDVAVLAIPQK